jgi:4'-phosphopantetheinyl transferase
VWVAPLDSAPAHLTDSLSPDERARAARFRSPEDARRYMVARGWLRHVLGAALGIAPVDVAISSNPGKPRVAGLSFNVSHAGELTLIAVDDHEVGVDVEPVSSGEAALEAAPLVCTPDELATLADLPPHEAAPLSLAWWTAKEAYLKATGEGFGFPPEQVGVAGVERGEASPVRIGTDPSGWWVRALQPAPGYVGAVAAEGPDWHVRLRLV